MSRFHEDIRQTLLEVEKFLLSTLNGISLTKEAKKQKERILSKIDSLRDNYSSLLPLREVPDDDVSGETFDDGSGGSAGVEDSEELIYTDVIVPIAASDLLNSTKAGVLMKRRKPGSKTLLLSGYQKRWCVLKNNVFYYYEKHLDKKQAGAFYVSDYEFRDAPFLVEKEASKKDLSFELIRPGHRVYQFLATNKDEYNEWKEALEAASLIPEKQSPQVSVKSPVEVDPLSQETEEIYEPIDDTQAEGEPRPVSAEIYEDASARPPSGEIYDDCEVTATKTPTLPVTEAPSPPKQPSLPSQQPPPIPVNVPAKAPDLPPRNIKPPADAPQEIYDDCQAPTDAGPVYPDYSEWRLGAADDYENMYYGKWDCAAERQDELDFKRGDVLHILSKEYDTQHWWIAELSGRVGLVPKIYLTEAYELVD